MTTKRTPKPSARAFGLVPLARIKADDSANYRTEATNESDGESPSADQALRDSIALQGVLQPVGVVPVAGDRDHDFELVYGFRRFKAAQALGLPTIPAVVVDGASATDTGRKLANLAENMVRADLSPAELMEALSRVRDEHPDMTSTDLGRAVGRHPNYVANLLRLRKKLAPALLEAYRERGQAMSMRYLVQVCTLPPEEQASAYNALVTGSKGGRPEGPAKKPTRKAMPATAKQVAHWLAVSKRAHKQKPSAFTAGVVYALRCATGREKFELPEE